MSATAAAACACWRRVCLLSHPHKPAAAELAREILAYLRGRGEVEVRESSLWEPDTLQPHLQHVDGIIALGGDGTLLRAARSGSGHGVPALGIQMGRVGFLSEVQPDRWQPAVDAVLEGRHWVEERLMIQVRVRRPGTGAAGSEKFFRFSALNDAVISRGSLARVIETRIQLNGHTLARITCDGLIIATPTGSTGYALAAGGPILPPELRNFVIVPVAPHLSLSRPLVLSEGTEVRVHAVWDHEAMLTVDGHFHLDMEKGDEVTVSAHPQPALFARTGGRHDFYQTLVERLSKTY